MQAHSDARHMASYIWFSPVELGRLLMFGEFPGPNPDDPKPDDPYLLQVAVACIHAEDGRITLTDKRLRVFKDALVDEKELGSDAEVEEALSTHFGITL